MAKIKIDNSYKMTVTPMVNARFTMYFEISPAIAHHLDKIKTRSLTKAAYICSLIEADMRKKRSK